MLSKIKQCSVDNKIYNLMATIGVPYYSRYRKGIENTYYVKLQSKQNIRSNLRIIYKQISQLFL